MNMLLGALNLGGVSGDPNALPVGRYDGRVTKSEYVVSGDKNPPTISHVVSLKVDGGQYDGRTAQRWFKLGENPLNANGQPAQNAAEIVQFQNTMTDNNKDYYKKLWLDCNVPVHLVDSGQATPDMLVNAPVVFGMGERNGYINITFIDKRDVVPVAPMGMMQPQQMGVPFGQPQQPFQQPQQAPVMQPFQQPQQAPVMQQSQQPVQTQPQQQNPYQQQPQTQATNPWVNQPVQGQTHPQQNPDNPWQDLTSPEGLAQNQPQPAPTNEPPQVVFGGGTNENQIAPGVPN